MITETEQIAEVIVAAVQTATASLVADLKVVQSQVAGWEARWSDLGSLRERIAIVEDRAKSVPAPAVLETKDPAEWTSVAARLDALEQREPIAGPAGPAGVDGKDAAAVDVEALALRAAALIPVPKDGARGERGERGPAGETGKDAPAVDIEAIAGLAAARIPAPKDGRDGVNGTHGKDGADAPAVDLEDVARRAAVLVPMPKDGRDGIDGKDGIHGKDAPAIDVDDIVSRAAALVPRAKNGADGQDGRDGQPGVPGVPGRDGASGERGEKGVDGAPGRDGTLEGVTVKAVDDRTFELRRADGSSLGQLMFPVPIYKGVYAAGNGYVKGDSVTFGGSLWIAREATRDKPGDGATAWQLAVKAGREGREGKPGKDGASGPRGEKGDPGRNFS